jgi:hypothetical protein
MAEIYRVTIHGRVMESRNLRQLLSRAVAEKRNMDTRCRTVRRDYSSWVSALFVSPAAGEAGCRQGTV